MSDPHKYNPELPPEYVMQSGTPPPTNAVIANVDINDIRSPNDFKGISFSKYKKTDVRDQFIASMSKGKIEPACYWCAELICAGHFSDAWETILYYMSKHIHLGNPKLPIYIEMRYEAFRNIMKNGFVIHEFEVRNKEAIRKLFAEIICTLTLSNKKPSFESIKINREEEFDMTQMTERLKAPNMSYAETVWKAKDPKELFIALNEFSYRITSGSANMMAACYWIEWVIEFDNICRKRKEVCRCERRSKYMVENKYQMDVIWVFWDALFHYCVLLKNPLLEKTLSAINRLFCIKYTTACCKKRRYMLYYAIGLLTEPVQMNVDILPNKQTLQNVVSQINQVYKQIKKNEEAPKTDYLFNGFDKQRALERTMKQLEILGQIDEKNRVDTNGNER